MNLVGKTISEARAAAASVGKTVVDLNGENRPISESYEDGQVIYVRVIAGIVAEQE